VLGAAFKPYSDDVRDSPALDVARILHGMGAQVTVYDPAALANARRACPDLGYADSVADAARDAQVVLLLTEWPEFTGLSPGDLQHGGTTEHRRRPECPIRGWRDAGWNYRALGW
jgi:UDPglucose 6-dehydrogenase